LLNNLNKILMKNKAKKIIDTHKSELPLSFRFIEIIKKEKQKKMILKSCYSKFHQTNHFFFETHNKDMNTNTGKI